MTSSCMYYVSFGGSISMRLTEMGKNDKMKIVFIKNLITEARNFINY